MAEFKNGQCTCKDCEDQRKALQRQLDHPFYKRVDDFRDEAKMEALTKASTKYKEPFNPGSWSIRQLGKHAMSENYDQGNYIVGLMEAAEELESKLNYISGFVRTIANADWYKQKDNIEYIRKEAADVLYLMDQPNLEKSLLDRRKGRKGVVIDERV